MRLNKAAVDVLKAGLEKAQADLKNRQYWLEQAVGGRVNAEASLASARRTEAEYALQFQQAADKVRDLEAALNVE